MLFSAAANADALLVTLHKSESDYSPTTMYQDYASLGEADYVEHRGERPIAITWRLRVPMPAADFATASVVQ